MIENKCCLQGNSSPTGAWEQACRTAFKSDRWPSVIWENGRAAPRCRVPLSVIGCAQGGYELIPFGTADLSLEDYADLAMRLMGISKIHPLICQHPITLRVMGCSLFPL